jgi:excinuclease ABC subunit A
MMTMNRTSINKNSTTKSEIHLFGVRQNNLKNVNVSIPLNSFCVICGPSGSGKSSLAFETLYAEGQRRFIDSLSNYSKQFLNKSSKPDLDSVENIPPALALEQKNTVRNSRSTVGTLSETIDLLRLFYEKIGQVYCPDHKTPLHKDSSASAALATVGLFNEKRGYILIQIDSNNRLFSQKDLYNELKKQGFLRFLKKIDNKMENFELDDPKIAKTGVPKKEFYVVIDRLAFKKDNLGRIQDSIQLAYDNSLHFNSYLNYPRCFVVTTENDVIKFSEEFSCRQCDYKFPQVTNHLFNFNSPIGACETCNGFGYNLELDTNKIIPNSNLTIAQGAIKPLTMPSGKKDLKKLKEFCLQENIDTHLPWKELNKTQKESILYGKKEYKGIFNIFKLLEKKKYKMHVRIFLARFKSPFKCKICNGSRLKKEVNQVLLENKNINQLLNLTIDQLYDFFNEIKFTEYQLQILKDLRPQLLHKLLYLKKVGVGYLTLNRETKSLSGGEFQRISLSNQLGLSLSQTLYVLDEPTIGLHPRDNERLISIMKDLNDLGNTLVVVEHDHDVILNSNHIIEMGPGSGTQGGTILYSGDKENFFKQESSLTKEFLLHKVKKQIREYLPVDLKSHKYLLELSGAKGNNLKNINLKIPLNRLVAITGVSGSGKSTLITKTLFPALANELKIDSFSPLSFKKLTGSEFLKNVLYIDQSAIGKTSRSHPASYLNFYDPIRNLFAKQSLSLSRGYKPGTFSLNVEGGRCPNCKGLGYEEVDMVYMDNIVLQCEECMGKKFRREVLEVIYKGKNINEILNMTVDDAFHFFVEFSNIRKPLNLLKEVGLGYISIGQAANTLSGGESQRLKIAKELHASQQKGVLFILDEPTTGLHFKEVHQLIKVLDKLVQSGSSVIVIEHNQDIIANADYIIDIGPEAGEFGGKIIAEGDVCNFIKKKSITAQYLNKYLKEGQ